VTQFLQQSSLLNYKKTSGLIDCWHPYLQMSASERNVKPKEVLQLQENLPAARNRRAYINAELSDSERDMERSRLLIVNFYCHMLVFVVDAHL
jgi:isochorismate hydrolase